MKTNHWGAIKSTVVALALVLAGGLAQAAPGAPAPKVLPPNSNAYGMGYDELAAGWLEWVTSIPNASSPLFDTDGSYAAIGQGGKIWFLAGNFGGSDTRTVAVPAGKALFFPILNYFWVEYAGAGRQPVVTRARSLRAFGARGIHRHRTEPCAEDRRADDSARVRTSSCEQHDGNVRAADRQSVWCISWAARVRRRRLLGVAATHVRWEAHDSLQRRAWGLTGMVLGCDL